MDAAFHQALLLYEYRNSHNISFNEATEIFRKNRIFEYIRDFDGKLEMMGLGDLYDIEELISLGGYKYGIKT